MSVKRMAAPFVASVASAFAVGTADAATPALCKNYTNLNKRYPYGVGRFGAPPRGAMQTGFIRRMVCMR